MAHDDVIDNSPIRRGMPTVNINWGNKAAILFGDYLFASVLKQVSDYKDNDFLAILSNIVQSIVKGELLQINKSRNLESAEEAYWEIINKKTSSLFSACFAMGALAAEASNYE